MCGTTSPLPHTPSWRGAQIRIRDNFIFNRSSYLNKKLMGGTGKIYFFIYYFDANTSCKWYTIHTIFLMNDALETESQMHNN